MKRPWMPASAGMTSKSTGHHVIPTKVGLSFNGAKAPCMDDSGGSRHPENLGKRRISSLSSINAAQALVADTIAEILRWNEEEKKRQQQVLAKTIQHATKFTER